MSSVSENYYYNQLSPRCRKAYARLLDAVTHFKPTAEVRDCGLAAGEPEKVYQFLCLDHPEIIWLAKELRLETLAPAGTITEYVRFCPQYILTKAEVDDLRPRLIRGAAPIRQAMQGRKDDWSRVLAAHDALIQLADYDRVKDDDDDHSLIGTLLNHRGVCEAYAETFTWVLRAEGIPCITCIGGGHAWNCVTVDGVSAFLDVTWDDFGNENGASGISYRCFCLTSQEMDTLHGFSSQYPVPVCSSGSLNYHNRLNLTASDLEELRRQIGTALKARRAFLELRVSPSLIPLFGKQIGKQRPLWVPEKGSVPKFSYRSYQPDTATGWVRLDFKYA